MRASLLDAIFDAARFISACAESIAFDFFLPSDADCLIIGLQKRDAAGRRFAASLFAAYAYAAASSAPTYVRPPFMPSLRHVSRLRSPR